MMFDLRKANENDINLLINYKLLTIYDYAENLSNDEINKIQEYVNNSVLEDLDKYKVIMVSGNDVGSLLVTSYENGVLLDEIYLEEKYRCSGIGTSIIKNILNEHSVVYLWVYKKNVKAINLYEKLGFIKFKETETRYFMKYEKEQ